MKSRIGVIVLCIICLFPFVIVTVAAERGSYEHSSHTGPDSVSVSAVPLSVPENSGGAGPEGYSAVSASVARRSVPSLPDGPLFPQALALPYAERLIAAKKLQDSVYYVPYADEAELPFSFNEDRTQSVLLNNDSVAFYGQPRSKAKGIVGLYSLPELEPLLLAFAAQYDEANGRRGVIPALYLIYGTCWPEGEIGILPDKLTEEYIEYAAERGWYVFLDHQIGKYTVEQAVETLLPFLSYPNVHLALDPEWRTTKPMQELGSVTGAEINKAQQMIQDYMNENGIPGKRMLVIHQFKEKMIRGRTAVKSDFEKISLILCADGFGPPALKKDTYAYNALATNIPLKSFKLFSKPQIAGAGYDEPMMTPEEVLSLEPRPCLIMIQ